MVGVQHYLVVGALLFAIGLFGALTRRNAIGILMAIELMFNAVNLTVVGLARYQPSFSYHGQMFAVFIISVAAAEAAVGLAIVLGLYRSFRTVNVDEIDLMKW
jgi:NADH-quinone oxidoreductase subunit K